jgi:hypothetical protein
VLPPAHRISLLAAAGKETMTFGGRPHEVQPAEPAVSEKPYPSPLPIIAILAILLLLVGGYVGAYLGAGFRVDWKAAPSGDIGTIERTYTSKWAVTVFAPAAWAETKMRDVLVHTVYVSPGYQQRLRKLRESSLPNSSAPAPNSVKP